MFNIWVWKTCKVECRYKNVIGIKSREIYFVFCTVFSILGFARQMERLTKHYNINRHNEHKYIVLDLYQWLSRGDLRPRQIIYSNFNFILHNGCIS